MFKLKNHAFCLLTAFGGMLLTPAWGEPVAPWLRAYINGEEVVGTTLESRYSTPEDEPASPVIQWEKADSRTGKPVLVQMDCWKRSPIPTPSRDGIPGRKSVTC